MKRSEKKVPELDRRKAVVSLLSEACDVMPECSFSEILYSVLRKIKPAGTKVGWVLDVKDCSIFSVVDSLIIEEISIRNEEKKAQKAKKAAKSGNGGSKVKKIKT